MKRLVFILLLAFSIYNISFAENKNVKVIEMALAKSVKNRIPEIIGDEVPNNIKRLYFWTKILAKEPPTYIYHVWYYKGEEVARIRLYIKYPIFRTWSFKTIPPSWTGKWKVVVEDENGNQIVEKHFKVVKTEKKEK